MSKYIQVGISDFEQLFCCSNKHKPTERAFILHEPKGQEAFYSCKLKETPVGVLELKVYTSVASGSSAGRAVGEDAIRIAVVWTDALGWSAPIGEKPARVYRAGGEGATARTVVARALERARETAKAAVKAPLCPKCGRVMVERTGKTGPFYGCIGFGENRAKCYGSRNKT